MDMAVRTGKLGISAWLKGASPAAAVWYGGKAHVFGADVANLLKEAWEPILAPQTVGEMEKDQIDDYVSYLKPYKWEAPELTPEMLQASAWERGTRVLGLI